MNKIYKVIWSKTKKCYVVVSELTKSHSKSSKSKVVSSLLLAGIFSSLLNFHFVLPVYAAAYNAGGGTASGTNSVSIGTGSKATGDTSSAYGPGSQAYGLRSVAIGHNVIAGYESNPNAASIAIGTNTGSYGLYSIAMGKDTNSYGSYSIALAGGTAGNSLESPTHFNIAIGNNALASANHSFAIGSLSKATADNAIAIGSGSNSLGDLSLSVGNNAKSLKENSVSFGANAVSSEKNSVVIGTNSSATNVNDVVIGSNSKSSSTLSSDGSIIIGHDALNIKGTNSNSISDASNYGGWENVIIGGSASSIGSADSVVIGESANIQDASDSIVIGNRASVATDSTGDFIEDAIAIGHGATASVNGAIALGYSRTKGENSIAIGHGDTAHKSDNILLGNYSTSNLTDAISIGKNNVVSNTYEDFEIAGNYAGSVLAGNNISAETSNGTGRYTTGDLYEITVNNDNTVNVSNDFEKISHVVGIGDNVKIGDMDTVAIGYYAKATSKSATAVGHGANASAEESLALGTAKASGLMSSSIGWGSSASNMGATAVGPMSSTKGDFDIALGFKSKINSNKGYNTAIGYKSTIDNYAQDSIAVGSRSNVTKNNAVAIGTYSNAEGENSIALGQRTIANANHSVAIGSNSVAMDENVVSFGRGPNDPLLTEYSDSYRFFREGDELAMVESESVMGHQMVSPTEYKRRLIHVADGIDDSDVATVGQLNAAIDGIGSSTVDISNMGENNTIERVVKPIVIGRNIEAKNQDYGQDMNLSDSDRTGLVAIGNDISASDLNSTYRNTRVTGDSIALPINANRIAHDVAIGDEVKLADANAIGVGYKAQAMGYNAVAIGYNTEANRQNDIAIGNAAQTTGYHNIAMGNAAKATANTALAIGPVANASGLGSISTGFNATSSGKESTAIGTKASSQADYSLSIGSYSRANGQASIALGQGSTSEANAIALGKHSNALANSIAIGSESVAKNENEISFGHSAGDSIEYAESTAILDEEYYYGNSMLTGHGEKTYDDDLNRRLTHIADGINDNDAATVGQLNSAIANIGGGTGNTTNAVVYDDSNHNTLTLAGTRGTKLTNLKQASLSRTSTDAVTGSQLWQTNQNITGFAQDIAFNRDTIATLNNSITNTLGSISAVTNLINTVDENKANASLSNIDSSGRTLITNIANDAITQYLQDNGGLSATNPTNSSKLLMRSTPSLGASLDNDIITSSNDDITLDTDTYSSSVINDMMDAKADLSYVDTQLSLKADTSYVNEKLDTKADKDSVYGKDEVYNKEEADTLLDAKADKSELDAKAEVDASNIDTNAWASKLGVGQILPENTGLVNGGTVYNALQSVKGNDLMTIENDVIRLGGNEKYKDIQTIDISNSEGNGRVMTGILVNPDDPNSATNVGYVNAISENIIAGVNSGFNKVNDKINQVGANAAAMASLTPASMDGDEKWTLSASVGNYRSETAGAVGLFYKPSDSVLVNVRGSFGNDESMVGGGVAVALDKGSTPGVSKAQLVREVNAMKQEREMDRQTIAEQGREIAELKAMVQELSKHK